MKMNNNDILVRLRYALDIKDAEMVEIFGLGGIEITKEEVQKLLLKSKNRSNNESEDDELLFDEYMKKLDNHTLESFLNGFIIYKRGPQDSNAENTEKQALMIMNNKNVNNILLKKMKIALSLTGEDMLDILKDTEVTISKSELSAVLRKEGHRNYKECGDRYARNFLKGLAIRYRK
ncbi:YehS family protein [Sporosarcina sp. FSL K6-1508]|uniref:DUF1456 family protein n=1 Tax=Sporosarcina sp. FSL K6-1508 TaxID=2921553 RepID=UPI0030FB5680